MPGHPPCPRCYSEEEVLRPWPGFRVARRIWLGGLAVIAALSPILFSDLFVMIPMTMAFLFAGGPVLEHARQTPTCRECGLSRPHPGWHETPCRPVRALPRQAALRQQPSPHAFADEESGVRPLPSEPPTGESAPS
jgi:hypothetical protein